MRLLVVLSVLIGGFVLACSTVTPVPAEPTPSIDATAVVEPTLDIDATVEARLSHERAAEAAELRPEPIGYAWSAVGEFLDSRRSCNCIDPIPNVP